MQLHDALTLDAPIRTKDGFLAVRAKAARAGTYTYLGSEVDPQGTKFKANDRVTVYRPADEVFARDSVGSFFAKPITDNHPRDAVTKDNWRQHARGAVMGALKDGEYLAFDLVLMDAAAIDAVDSGKRELSNGYSCDLSFEDGQAPDGTPYQAVQRNIRGNHVAIVDRGRAGSECRIVDSFASCDANPGALPAITPVEKTVMKIRIGDAEVDATNGEAVRIAVDALNTKLTDTTKRLGTAETQVATLSTDKATLEAKVTTLEQQVKDAKLSPQQLRDAAKAYAVVVEQAKKLGANVTDGMDETTIKRTVVDAKLGDKAKDWSEDQISASFDALTAHLGDVQPVDHVRDALKRGLTPIVNDNATVRDVARASQY